MGVRVARRHTALLTWNHLKEREKGTKAEVVDRVREEPQHQRSIELMGYRSESTTWEMQRVMTAVNGATRLCGELACTFERQLQCQFSGSGEN